jgi:hypothetical protein
MTKPNQARRIGKRPKWPMSVYSASPPVTASTTEPEREEGQARMGADEADGVERIEAASTPGCGDLEHAEQPSTANQPP